MVRLFFLAFLGFILFTYAVNVQFFPLYPFDDKRVIQLLLIATALLWVVLGGFKQYPDLSSWSLPINISLGALLLLSIVSSLLAASPRHAFLETSVFIGLFYLSLCVAACWREGQQAIPIVLLVVISLGAVVYMVGFFSGYLASFIEGIPLEWPEPFFMFSNVRQFNQYQLWTFGLLCWPLLLPGLLSSRQLYEAVAGLSAWWVLLFASSSRGVLLAYVISMLITGGLFRHFASAFLWRQFKCALFGLVGYGLLFLWLPQFNRGGGSVVTTSVLRTETSDRLGLWRLAGAMIEAHPWLGVGPMHYAWYPNPLAAHPHNSLLQLACEFGLPATGLIVFILGYGIYRWWQRFNINTLNALPEREGQLAIVLFFTVVAEAIYSLVDGVIVMPLSQVMMAFVLGLMMGLYGQNRATVPISFVFDVLHRLLAGATLVVLVWAVLPELIPRILGDYEQVPKGYSYEIMAPRFWQEGGIPHQKY